MNPAAAAILNTTGHGALGTACWDLKSGELRSFDEAFLKFSDLRLSEAFSSMRPLCMDVLRGKNCIFLYPSTRDRVTLSLKHLHDIEDGFSSGESVEQTADMNFVTRIGRQRPCTVHFFYLAAHHDAFSSWATEILWVIAEQQVPVVMVAAEQLSELSSCSVTVTAPFRVPTPWTALSQRFTYKFQTSTRRARRKKEEDQ